MLMLRGTDPIASRAKNYASVAGIVAAVLFIIGGFMISGMKGYTLISGDPGMSANPVSGQVVEAVSGGWMHNYGAHPILWLIPILAIACMLLGALLLRANKPILGWWLGALAWIGVLGTVAASMFPFLMPSSDNLNQSLTIWNASGSRYNLIWMTIFTAIFVPTILAYTTWCFRVMRGKVAKPSAADDHAY
jgi:cytochrome d ubiquinol oxidase subunit II